MEGEPEGNVDQQEEKGEEEEEEEEGKQDWSAVAAALDEAGKQGNAPLRESVDTGFFGSDSQKTLQKRKARGKQKPPHVGRSLPKSIFSPPSPWIVAPPPIEVFPQDSSKVRDDFFLHPALVPRKDGEVGLDDLPTNLLHKIFRLLDEESKGSISRNVLALLCTSKKFLDEALKRGGLPSWRPRFCVMHCARRANAERLKEKMEVIGAPAFEPSLLSSALLEVMANGYGSQVEECAAFLLSKGADVNCASINGAPIHFACKKGKLGIVRLLVAHGASLLETDSLGFDGYRWAYNSAIVGFEEALVKEFPKEEQKPPTRKNKNHEEY